MATTSNRSSGSQINQRGITQGTTLVDPKTGYPVNVILDGTGKYRLCVDAAITLDATSLSVDLDVIDDGVHIGNPSTGDILLVNPDGSINVNTKVDAKDGDNISISGHSSPIFSENADTLTTVGYEEIFSYTSVNANTKIIKLECTCATTSNFRIKIDGVIKKILRSSPIERNIIFKFEEHRPLLTAQVLTVEAQVERLILGSYDTFVSLEGYIA